MSDPRADRDMEVLLQAINVTGDVVLVYRVDDDGTVRLAFMNDAYTRRSGFTREEAVGKSIEMFRQSMPDDPGMRQVREALRTGVATEAELVSYRKDGSTYWNQVSLYPIADAKGRVAHWISIERDISDEVKRTTLLEEEYDRLVALVRSARRLFTALDARALVSRLSDIMHELLSIDASVLAVIGGSSAQVEELGRIVNLAATDDALVAEAILRRSRVVSPAKDRTVAYAGRFGDAEYVLDLRHGAHPLRNADFFVIDLLAEYFAVAARNVTLYHELDERRSAVLDLSQSKSDLIAMLAHDFRGPLTSIVGFAELTGEVADVTDEQHEFLETIKRSALQLSELAADTLTLSRLERNEVGLSVSDVSLQTMIESIVAQYADRRVVTLTSRGDTTVVGDADRLQQVFSNLIDNAIKYSLDATPPSVEIDGSSDPVIIKIIDHGIGIPANELASIFGRFSRASNARKMRIQGTGFGLFLARQLVQLHGGTITVESREGEGSTFIASIPRRIPRSSAPKTIAILDRREHSFLAYGLREAGYRIVTASTLEELLSIADSQPVDALLVNLAGSDLPNERAVQLRTFSRERFVPIVALAESPLVILGAAATLVPPASVGDVVSAFERVLGPSAAS